MRIASQTVVANNMLKNTALEAQSLAIFACLFHFIVTKFTQASMLVLIASAIRIKNKTPINNKCSIKPIGRKKLRIKQGIIMQSSILKAVSLKRNCIPFNA